MNFLSKDPRLSLEKLLVFGALGLYVYRHIQLKKQGELKGEPDLLVKIDKQKIFDHASNYFQMNPSQRSMLEGLYDTILRSKNEKAS